MMKAHKLQQDDNDLTFAPAKIASPLKITGPLAQERPKERTPVLKDQLAQRDIEVIRRGLEHLKTRSERVEELKSQVNAGTYEVDSAKIAQRMAFLPQTRKILDRERNALLEFKDEE